MPRKTAALTWQPILPPDNGPIYLALADAIETDIAAGRLRPGQALPAHRPLAAALGVDLTTITRAYSEARRRGLIVATTGRGTFVRPDSPAEPPAAPTRLRVVTDTSMNLPPQPPAARLSERVSEVVTAILQGPDAGALLNYRDSAVGDSDRAAGAAWLKPRLGTLPAGRVLVCSGAQGAFLTLLNTVVRAGDVVVTEALTYPGFRSLAAQLGITLVGLAMDGEGLLPDAFEAACRSHAPKALYCTPTMHNPTTATLPAVRREAIVAIARRYGVAIVEDDAYGLLTRGGPVPLATLAPDITYHVSTLSKCLLPGLRIAYLVVPDAATAARLAAAMRALVLMVSPLATAVATRWIGDGTAHKILGAIRGEAAARQQIARQALNGSTYAADPDGHHLWLSLPKGWTVTEFVTHFRPRGLAAVPADAFAVEDAAGKREPSAAVRLPLGAAPGQPQLREQLEMVATALSQPFAVWSAVT